MFNQLLNEYQTNPDYNVAISARSGAGQSFLTNELIELVNAARVKVSSVYAVDSGSGVNHTTLIRQ